MKDDVFFLIPLGNSILEFDMVTPLAQFLQNMQITNSSVLLLTCRNLKYIMYQNDLSNYLKKLSSHYNSSDTLLYQLKLLNMVPYFTLVSCRNYSISMSLW